MLAWCFHLSSSFMETSSNTKVTNLLGVGGSRPLEQLTKTFEITAFYAVSKQEIELKLGKGKENFDLLILFPVQNHIKGEYL